METQSTAQPDNAVRASLLLLTCTAGLVDATAYLRLGQVFVANMTGNSVLLALRVAGVEANPILGNVLGLIGFCAGAGLGAILLRNALKPGRRALTPLLVIEVILMSAAALVWYFIGTTNQLVLIGITSTAMGMQAAMALRVAVSGVSTITITNTLTRAMSELFAPKRDTHYDNWVTLPVLFLAFDWTAYFFGALVAATGIKMGFDVQYLLAVLLLVAVLVLAISDQRE